MKINSTITFEFKSAEDAAIFYKSFLPELSSIPMKRSELNIEKPKSSDAKIYCKITADDAVGYRATVNTLIQTAHTVEEVINIVEEEL